MFRIKACEKNTTSKNSYVLCLFDDGKGVTNQVVAKLIEIWKWHPEGDPNNKHYAFFVKCKQTVLMTMHRPTNFNLYTVNMEIARGSATGEFVSLSNISHVNPILFPHIMVHGAGRVRDASRHMYYVIDPHDQVAQWR